MSPSPLKSPGYATGSLVLFLSVLTIAMALAFEHLGGYKPCPLCLQERWAYYFAIPAAFAAMVFIGAELPRIAALTLFAVALAYLANTGLGAYHAGAEWGFWPGPSTCSGGDVTNDASNLMNSIAGERTVRCDEASLRVLGISFAGWNALMSLFLFGAALKAAFAAASAPRPA